MLPWIGIKEAIEKYKNIQNWIFVYFFA
jgi:hypothetical protein